VKVSVGVDEKVFHPCVNLVLSNPAAVFLFINSVILDRDLGS
jgi:hypothetical protein